ncbi:alcohol dehydrogenase GroES-like domain protein [Sphingomonas sp. S17]|uniref:NAD(P)-dependent alcohol dehydrogenase n=2 Tax=Sphingomonas paucimobilis TaxID=13689 RepID=A0A411LFZ1_SPHPI|nr:MULTISPECIES: NAD(P)-dependent alcohol dehydrogenase [Sphingomonas]EGI57015.1 alcohol dehydrogenase GroES-like domain protein [Sphingomonas sp. S17]MBQ1480079.1 NAD(P)-dependent alcohol dehydrogenase [Sphingomonas sp.]MCM3679018.1 NAD(P)-dependent alcohol dehydrogenase [Sphingomonas paucimobilis]MDG5971772.1 NAD(P)-dependent alcohol dehydrogenase [Sphingomonas paucimobilis]NNG58218.1 NAD(P)-dependent alcohol dehydrogenase [Sphingomonas paucimobilis]
MKAMILDAPGGLDRLRLVDRPDPGAPGPGMIRVRLHATSLNYHDYGIVSGNMPTEDGRIPMADGAGLVEAIGDGVTELAVGDAVVSCFFPGWLEGPPRVGDFATVPGDGIDGYALETVVAPATAFTRAPQGYDHAEAATITTAGLTAWRSLVVDGGLKAGDRILVLGTGGVSIWALQIAKHMGASVAVTSSSGEKLERARALGADFTVNYREQEQWGRQVHDWADGGVDHVIEVGGPATLAQSIDAVRIGGHIGLIGVLTGVSGQVPTAALMAKQARLQGLIVGSRRMQQEFVRALDTSDIRPVIDRRFPLEGLVDAFRHQESGSHFGKIAVTW